MTLGRASLPRPPAALFLDFDGVVLESADIKTNAFRTLYAPHGDAVAARVIAHHLEHAGISRRVKIRHAHKAFLGIDLDEDALERLAQQFAEIVEGQVIAAPWVAGTEGLIRTARNRGLSVFVASGTPEDELKRIVQKRGMVGYFTEVHGSPRLKEEILGDLLDRYRLSAEACIMIGDGSTDFDAATALGMPFLGRVRPHEISCFPGNVPALPDMTIAPRLLGLDGGA